MWFKACPRCSGDLYPDEDSDGKFITCIQCGFSKDVKQGSDGKFLPCEPAPYSPMVQKYDPKTPGG